MQNIGAKASLLIGQLDPVDLLKLFTAYEPAGDKDVSWAKVEASQHVWKYAYPSISLDVVLGMQVPSPLLKAKYGTCMSVGETLRTISG